MGAIDFALSKGYTFSCMQFYQGVCGAEWAMTLCTDWCKGAPLTHVTLFLDANVIIELN